MKTVWIASLVIVVPMSALAQLTIYKLVDENGRVTYSNRPMKGASVMELEPLTTIPTPPAVISAKTALAAAPAAAPAPEKERVEAKADKAVAVVTPITALASIDTTTQKRRDLDRRRILGEELAKEEEALRTARESLTQEQVNPTLVSAVRAAQQAVDPTPTQLAEFRQNIDKASGRIRGLQATVGEHEKNVEAIRKELDALK